MYIILNLLIQYTYLQPYTYLQIATGQLVIAKWLCKTPCHISLGFQHSFFLVLKLPSQVFMHFSGVKGRWKLYRLFSSHSHWYLQCWRVRQRFSPLLHFFIQTTGEVERMGRDGWREGGGEKKRVRKRKSQQREKNRAQLWYQDVKMFCSHNDTVCICSGLSQVCTNLVLPEQNQSSGIKSIVKEKDRSFSYTQTFLYI